MSENDKPGNAGTFDWMSNPQYLAQVSHFFGAACLILMVALFSLARGKGWMPVLIAFAGGMLLATIKEFVFDVASWGEEDSWSDSIMDWGFYMLGGLVGLALVFFAFRMAQHG